jgi:hypothetical protein
LKGVLDDIMDPKNESQTVCRLSEIWQPGGEDTAFVDQLLDLGHSDMDSRVEAYQNQAGIVKSRPKVTQEFQDGAQETDGGDEGHKISIAELLGKSKDHPAQKTEDSSDQSGLDLHVLWAVADETRGGEEGQQD